MRPPWPHCSNASDHVHMYIVHVVSMKRYVSTTIIGSLDAQEIHMQGSSQDAKND